MSDALKIDKSKAQSVEFEVNIHGVLTEKPRVRFVINNIMGGSLAFECNRVEGDRKKWSVDLPALDVLREDHTYSIQLIADDYFFEPATGIIELCTDDSKPVVESVSLTPDLTDDILREAAPVMSAAPEVESMVEKVITETLGGKAKKPAKPGFLLSKKLFDPEIQRQREENSKKVRDILNKKR